MTLTKNSLFFILALQIIIVISAISSFYELKEKDQTIEDLRIELEMKQEIIDLEAC